MTPKPRRRVEKVAEEMCRLVGKCGGLLHEDTARAIARWHLRELRKARGRTVGCVALSSEEAGGNFGCVRPMPRDHGAVTIQAGLGWRVARVVLEPRRGTKGPKR